MLLKKEDFHTLHFVAQSTSGGTAVHCYEEWFTFLRPASDVIREVICAEPWVQPPQLYDFRVYFCNICDFRVPAATIMSLSLRFFCIFLYYKRFCALCEKQNKIFL